MNACGQGGYRKERRTDVALTRSQKALRTAAIHFAYAFKNPVKDANDSTFVEAGRRLEIAARAFSRKAIKKARKS